MHDNELRRGHLRFSGGKLAGNEAFLSRWSFCEAKADEAKSLIENCFYTIQDLGPL